MNGRTEYIFDKDSFFGHLAVICLLAAMIARAVGAFAIREMIFSGWYTVVTQLALPIGCCLLMIVCILAAGKRAFWLSSIPYLVWVLFMIMRVFSFDNIAQVERSLLYQMLSILFYLFLTMIYSATVFGGIRTKWALVPVFALPMAFHIFVEDVPAISGGYASVSSLLMEISVLLMMLSMLVMTLGVRKRKILREVNPDSGKTVAPPLPQDQLKKNRFGRKAKTVPEVPATEHSDSTADHGAEGECPADNHGTTVATTEAQDTSSDPFESQPIVLTLTPEDEKENPESSPAQPEDAHTNEAEPIIVSGIRLSLEPQAEDNKDAFSSEGPSAENASAEPVPEAPAEKSEPESAQETTKAGFFTRMKKKFVTSVKKDIADEGETEKQADGDAADPSADATGIPASSESDTGTAGTEEAAAEDAAQSYSVTESSTDGEEE